MAKLVTVTALDLVHVLRLGAFARGMALAIAVAANDLLLLGAVSGTVTFLATVVTAAATTTTLRTVAREVAI